MAWGDIGADDLVSFTNMQTSGISLNAGQTASTSNDIMTKSSATTKYNLDLAVSTLAAKNSLDCVAKKDLVAGTVTLTVAVQSNGRWFGSLSAGLTGDVTIGFGIASGYYDECIGTPDLLLTMEASYPPLLFPIYEFTIWAGNTYQDHLADSSDTFVNSVYYKMLDGVEINGTMRYNGNTFTIAGVDVTLVLPISCTLFP